MYINITLSNVIVCTNWTCVCVCVCVCSYKYRLVCSHSPSLFFFIFRSVYTLSLYRAHPYTQRHTHFGRPSVRMYARTRTIVYQVVHVHALNIFLPCVSVKYRIVVFSPSHSSIFPIVCRRCRLLRLQMRL